MPWEEVEATLVTILSNLVVETNGQLILLGYHMHSELKALSKYFPAALAFFSAWKDLIDLVADWTGLQQPALTDIISAFGLDLKLGPTRPRSKLTHNNAGNDTIRILAVLIGLMDFIQNGNHLHVSRSPPRPLPKIFTARPHPQEDFPHVAELETVDNSCLPPEMDSGFKLYHFLATYNLAAIAVKGHKSREGVGQSTQRTHGRYAWICTANEEDLQAFVHEWHGRELSGTRFIAKVICDAESTSGTRSNGSGIAK